MDTVGRWLNLLDPETEHNEAWSVPDEIGMVAERSEWALAAALGCDLAVLGDDGQVERIATAPAALPGFRLNDGRFDDAGRL